MKTALDLYQDKDFMSGLLEQEIDQAGYATAVNKVDEIALDKAVREQCKSFDDIAVDQLADNSDALASLFNFLEIASAQTGSDQAFLLAQDRLLIDAAELFTRIKQALVSIDAEERNQGIVTSEGQKLFIKQNQTMHEAGINNAMFHPAGALS